MNRRISLAFHFLAVAAFLVGWATVPTRAHVSEPMFSQHDPGYALDLSFADVVLSDRTVVQASLEPPPAVEPDQAQLPLASAVLASIDITARWQHYRRLRWDAG